MKRTKKTVSILLALVMTVCSALTAFAANITITGGASGAEYAAYRLLKATDGGDGKIAYTLNSKYTDILQDITGKTTGSDIVDYISKLDAEAIREFADSVYGEIKSASITADVTATGNEFNNVDQGYYLIAETKTGGDSDTYSLVMLDTAGKSNITVETKEDAPTVTKKVTEKNDSTGDTSTQDAADYDIGDNVPFTLTGTVSAKYADYKKYYYAFHDTLSSGLKFNADSVVVKIDGTTIDTSKYSVVTTGPTDGCTFEIVFDNLKSINSVTKDSEITVEYTAELLSTATVGGSGNTNTVKLEYSNNPYDKDDGKPGTGKTPEDKVTVFTYKLVVNKVDGNKQALEGAGFTLYKYDSATSDYVAVGAEITGKTTFTFTGLDAGKYKLVETTVPDGYNQADDIVFTVEATYNTNSVDPKLTDLVVKDKDGAVISGTDKVFSITLNEGKVSTDVVNNSGTELPSTGGMGTYMFYIIGGIMVAVAIVLIVSKKRMEYKK